MYKRGTENVKRIIITKQELSFDNLPSSFNNYKILQLSDLHIDSIRNFEDILIEKINGLEAGFNFLIALGSIAPITGFLGTVSGMISAFKSIAALNALKVFAGSIELAPICPMINILDSISFILPPFFSLVI